MSSCNLHHQPSHNHHHEHVPKYPEINYGPGEKWIKSLTQGRLNQFTGGHFGDVNLSAVLFAERLDGPEHIELQVWSAPGRSKPSFEEAMKQKFEPVKKGASFGPSFVAPLAMVLPGLTAFSIGGQTIGGKLAFISHLAGIIMNVFNLSLILAARP